MSDREIAGEGRGGGGSGEGQEDLSELLESLAPVPVPDRRFRVTLGDSVVRSLGASVSRLLSQHELLSKNAAALIAPTLLWQSGLGDSFVKSVNASVGPLFAQQDLLSKNLGTLIAPTLLWQSELGESFARALRINDTLGRWASDFLKELPTRADLRRGLFPANLCAVDDIELDKCEHIMLNEGLPIAWVPRPATLEAIFSAPNAAKRRAVFGSRWRGIITDCEVLLKSMQSAQTAPYVGYALKSAQGLREGHHEMSQAFTATTLDSLLQKQLGQPLRRDVLGRKRFDSEGFTSRQFFAFSQLWGIHRPYFPSAGDKIPLSFNRHGSVHGVSRRQYRRINAVIGLAHLTSFLWFVDTTYTRRRPT